MFVQLADYLLSTLGANAPFANATNIVFQYRPVDLLNYLEQFWALSAPTNRSYVGDQGNTAAENSRRILAEPEVIGAGIDVENVRPAIPDVVLNAIPISDITYWPGPFQGVWKHIMYAYAIENTCVLEILRKVLCEILNGERLGRPDAIVLAWARNTEELFFADRLGHWIFSPVSRLRDDAGAIRRNAYYRMLGMDLNHGAGDGRPYPYLRPDAANRGFSSTFEQLLRETWRGYANRRNNIGPNQTDDSSLADLAARLRDMLRDRRLYGTLAREEFYSVATLSWFHLTVISDNAVVRWLDAEGNNAAERLSAIGTRVGLAPHKRAYNFFEMADALSEILIRIEHNEFDSTQTVPALYDDNLPTNYTDQMLRIINNWSAAAGRNLKEFVDGPVTMVPVRR